MNENIEWPCMHLELNYSIQLNSDLIKLNSNTWIGVSIELNSNSTTFNPRFNWKKWDTNWWKRYWKSSHEYDVGKNNKKLNTNPQKSFFQAFYLGMGYIFWTRFWYEKENYENHCA